MSRNRWLFTDLYWFYRNPLVQALRYPRNLYIEKTHKQRQRKGRAYLEQEGVLDLLESGQAEEHKADYSDLSYLHRNITARAPANVLEFGIGFSTLVIGHALKRNADSGRYGDKKPQLVSVDANEGWIENTRAKIPAGLEPYITVWHSECRTSIHNGEFCHYYDRLPNIKPDFIYLDGPSPLDVQGDFHNLRFIMDDGSKRPVMSADILAYEASLPRGTLIVVDGRHCNTHFLRRNLRRRYHFSDNRTDHRYTFELLD
jgi:hypothetical protein